MDYAGVQNKNILREFIIFFRKVEKKKKLSRKAKRKQGKKIIEKGTDLLIMYKIKNFKV